MKPQHLDLSDPADSSIPMVTLDDVTALQALPVRERFSELHHCFVRGVVRVPALIEEHFPQELALLRATALPNGLKRYHAAFQEGTLVRVGFRDRPVTTYRTVFARSYHDAEHICRRVGMPLVQLNGIPGASYTEAWALWDCATPEGFFTDDSSTGFVKINPLKDKLLLLLEQLSLPDPVL